MKLTLWNRIVCLGLVAAITTACSVVPLNPKSPQGWIELEGLSSKGKFEALYGAYSSDPCDVMKRYVEIKKQAPIEYSLPADVAAGHVGLRIIPCWLEVLADLPASDQINREAIQVFGYATRAKEIVVGKEQRFIHNRLLKAPLALSSPLFIDGVPTYYDKDMKRGYEIRKKWWELRHQMFESDEPQQILNMVRWQDALETLKYRQEEESALMCLRPYGYIAAPAMIKCMRLDDNGLVASEWAYMTGDRRFTRYKVNWESPEDYLTRAKLFTASFPTKERRLELVRIWWPEVKHQFANFPGLGAAIETEVESI